MECFPLCKTCTGLCRQTAPERPVAKPKTRKTLVAPERMPGYIVLVCGAYTTMEEQLMVPGFRKSRRRYWCEKHQHWATPYTFTQRVAKLAEEPLF
jgi:hypothetical protein